MAFISVIVSLRNSMAICSGSDSVAGAAAAGSGTGSKGSRLAGADARAAASGCGVSSGLGGEGTCGRSISGTTSAPVGPILRRSHKTAPNAPPPRRKAKTIHGQIDCAGVAGAATAGPTGANDGKGAAGVGLTAGPGKIAEVADGGAPVAWTAGADAGLVGGGTGRPAEGAGVGAGSDGTVIGAGAAEGIGVGAGAAGAGVGEGRGAGVGVPSTGPTTGGGVGVGVGFGGRRKSETCAAAGIASSAAMPARRNARVVIQAGSRSAPRAIRVGGEGVNSR